MFDFLATATGGKLAAQPGESLEAGWFEPGKGMKMITHPMIRDRMKILLSAKHGLIYRAYSKDPYHVHGEYRYP